MLNQLRRGGGQFEVVAPEPGWTPPADLIWLDLLNPSRQEELAVEAAFSLELPTPDEMAQLEPSSRLYQEGGATFMTATLLAHAGEGRPSMVPVTFVLVGEVLVTLRYQELRAFAMFAKRAAHQSATNGAAAVLGLLGAVVERLAEVLDLTGDAVETASTAIFERPPAGDFKPLMTDLARAQSITSLARGSLVSLARLISFAALDRQIADDPECREHLRSLHQDAQSLTEHASFLASHIAFLLDAALGLINIEQNGIIKFFSVVAVIFLPPTLVASIYGMNFDHMPELHWLWGYPLALAMMVVSAVAPLWWFRRRGWL